MISRGKYNLQGPDAQTFSAIEDKNSLSPRQAYEYVSLRIHSNHGNPDYTCLYRFRVHGTAVMSNDVTTGA